jgi:translocation and assembly module TamA
MDRVAHLALWYLVLVLPLAAAGQIQVEVRILGLEGDLASNVRALLSLERDKADPRLTPRIIERLHQRAPDEIRRALEPFGYYRPQIDARLLPPQAEDGTWLAEYRIDPEDPLRVTSADIGIVGPGGDDPKLRCEVDAFPLKPGRILDHRRYETGKRDLLQAARRLGYLEASLGRHRIDVDTQAYTARIAITLETGPRFRFGPAAFEQSGFDDAYLRSFIPFRTGDPYTPEPLAELRRALAATGAFQRVDVERLPAATEDPTLVPLLVHLEPFKPNVYRARVGWGTDTGFGVHFDWNRRYLWGRGHALRLGTVLVQERSKLVADADYAIPLDPLTQSRLELFARHQGKDLAYTDVGLSEGGTTRILNNTLGVSWARPRESWAGLELTEQVGLTFLTESYDVFDVLFGHFSPFVQGILETVLGEDREVLRPSFRALVPNFEWSVRRSDHAMFPRRAEYLSLELKGAFNGVGSNVGFWQARLGGVFIRPWGRDRIILRGDLGYTDADTIVVESLGNIAFNQLPELYEFRTGGARSVRGYGYETLLPADSVTGGKQLVVASVEYEKALADSWSAAVFTDVGNAFNDYAEMDLRQGAGVGVRWRSPVGLVRLDLAVPLSEADDPFQVYLTIGPEF